MPWWGVVSSTAAPVLLIGGWTVAANAQPGGFDPVAETISALAAGDAADPGLMTWALVGVGGCHVATALALRPARLAGRAVLATGGAATVLVALNPLPSGTSGSQPHVIAATVALTALATWPLLGWQHGRHVPVGLRPPVSTGAGVALLILLGWFLAELVAEGDRVGGAERVASAAQAMWPLIVVLTSRNRADRRCDGHG